MKIKVAGPPALPTPPPLPLAVGTSMVHGRLQMTSPKAAPNLTCRPLHTRSWNQPLCPRPGMTEPARDSDCPLADGGNGKVCTQLLTWQGVQGGSGGQTVVLMRTPSLCTLSDCLEGSVLRTFALFRRDLELPAAAAHKTKVL